MAKQLGLKQVFRQAGAVHRHQRPVGARAGFVNRLGNQFLAGAGLAQQQHRGLRRRNARHQRQHVLKGRRPPDQPLGRRLPLRHPQSLHFFDEKSLFPFGIQQRCQLDVDVLLALGRVVQVQHTLALAGSAGLRQRARLTGLVTRHVEVVRHLVAGAPDHALHRTELLPVSRIRRQDAVLQVKQNVRLAQAFKVGHQFGQWLHGGSLVSLTGSLCLNWQFLPNMAVNFLPPPGGYRIDCA